MTTYDWHTTYRNAVEAFNGQTPGPGLEQYLLEEFQHSPQTIIQAIDKAGAAFAAGKITSPWGIVRSELNRIQNQPDLKVTDTTQREKRKARAEQWIRAAGQHFDSETELVDELFGDRGQLKDHPDLQAHMLELWNTLRPKPDPKPRIPF